MTNNYFHDVATGLLIASAIALWVVAKSYERVDDTETAGCFLGLHATLTRTARYSMYWILLGGIPRTIFYTRFEWAESVGGTQVTAIIIKHVIVVALLITAAYYWRRIKLKVAEVKSDNTRLL